MDPAQLAQLMPGGEDAPALQQVAVQVEGEPGEDATQVIAQLLQADLPSPGTNISLYGSVVLKEHSSCGKELRRMFAHQCLNGLKS